MRAFQPDARTLVVRWRVQWQNEPPLGWSVLGGALLDEQAQPQPGAPSTQPADAVPADEELVSVTVASLTQRLEAAEAALADAAAALQREAPAAASASGALDAGLASLRSGLAMSRALKAEVEAAEAEEEAQTARAWAGLFGSADASPAGAAAAAEADARFAAQLAALRERLTSRVSGTSTLLLDAEGRVVSHADALDFDATALSTRNAALAQSAASVEAAEEAERVAAQRADAIFLFCMAHQAPGRDAWGWRFDVVKQLLWESFVRDDEVDDEVRMSLNRQEFDELVTGVVASVALTSSALTAYLTYWLVFVAPELPAQLEAARAGEAAASAGTLLPSLAQQAANLLLGPSLFS